jgi:Tol biopolymer transport system component/tetratricopeptide (TPR) repeat protein
MAPERWKQVEEIFNAALDRPVEEREAFLDEACGGDQPLRQQVEHLIYCHEQAGDFIESRAATSHDSLLIDEAVTLQFDSMIGRQVGAYRLVREIGRGGMGAVYLAVRADNQFSQNAAIKLIKRGMDTDFILRRFRNERQILAALNHPNIARLLDGGTTDDGLPYFVMEYIEGLPIHRYCDTHRLTIAERLKIFRQVCAAVAHAHEHQVIHRDIKPGNILVIEDGTPKLLDFGIAKILNPDLAYHTIDPTVTAMRMMTPEYASPEQARGEQVTDATDQYSLGVLLYELLTGQRPHQLRNRAPHEIARIISEEEPERPSDVVIRAREVTTSDGRRVITLTPEEVSRDRSSSPAELRRELAGSLDDIVMQSLGKNPRHRYSSVHELSQDLNRYLQGLHIAARAYVAKSELETVAGNVSPPATSDPACTYGDTASAVQIVIPKKVAWKAMVISAIAIALIAFIALFYYFRSSAPQSGSAAPIPPLRLTNSLTNDTHPKVSPDGKKIVFASERSGTPELYVMNIDGSGLRNLTDNTAHETSPAWSPDGRRVVFGVETVPLRESDIWVMDADGGNQVNLTNAPGYDARPAFSPDGTRIAFASNRGNGFLYNFDIWVMNTDGSNARRLTDYEEYEADVTWSPYGKRIAFTRAMLDKQFDILVINADGTNPVNLTNTAQFDETVPAWAPDGRLIAFASNRGSQNRNYNIWVMDADGANPRMVVPPPGHNTEPAWTPDRHRLVFQSTRDFNPEIYIANVEGEVEISVAGATPAAAKSIAVLPFKSKTANETEKLLGVGLADVITNKLGQIKQLSVRPASASRSYLESNLDPQNIGAELGVEYLISGALERDGERLRIDLQTFDLKEKKVVWKAKIDEKLTDISALQNSIAEGILRSLTIEPSGAGQKFFINRDTESSEAYQLYLAGRYHWGKRSIAGLNEAIKSFNGAIRKDPKFALAYAGLADCQALLQVYQSPPPPGAYVRARENALKALRLDDSLAEAHTSLAYVRFYFDRDRHRAEASFRRAIDLNPSYTTAHHWLAIALSAMGRHDEAMIEIRQAEQLNPQSAIIKTASGMIYFYARQFDRAINECRRALDLDPVWSRRTESYAGFIWLQDVTTALWWHTRKRRASAVMPEMTGLSFSPSCRPSEANAMRRSSTSKNRSLLCRLFAREIFSLSRSPSLMRCSVIMTRRWCGWQRLKPLDHPVSIMRWLIRALIACVLTLVLPD